MNPLDRSETSGQRASERSALCDVIFLVLFTFTVEADEFKRLLVLVLGAADKFKEFQNAWSVPSDDQRSGGKDKARRAAEARLRSYERDVCVLATTLVSTLNAHNFLFDRRNPTERCNTLLQLSQSSAAEAFSQAFADKRNNGTNF